MEKNEWKHGLFWLFFFVCFHGGYFYFESMILLFPAAFFLLFWQNDGWLKSNSTEGNGTDGEYGKPPIFPMLFLFFYFLPIFWGENMHLFGWFKILAPFLLVYLLLNRLSPMRIIAALMWGFWLSTIIALVISVVLPVFPNLSFFQLWINGRFASFVGYANTNALFSVLSLFYFLFERQHPLLAIVPGLSLALSGSRTVTVLAIPFLLVIFWRDRKRIKKGWQTLLFFILGFGAGTYIFTLFFGLHRLADGFGASEFQTRMLYYKDAVAMLIRQPFGYGHYGYFMAQRQFQTGSMYLVKHVHNDYLQMGLDAGVLTMLLWLFLTLRIGIGFIPLFREKRKESRLFFPFLLLMLHSFWDFDFAFSASFVLYWAIYFAVIPSARINPIRYFRPVVAGISSLALVILVLSYQSYRGKPQWQAELGFTEGVIRFLRSNAPEEEKVAIAEKWIETSGKNLETFAFLRDYYYNKENWKEALEYAERAVNSAPLWIVHREAWMRIAYAYALHHPEVTEEMAAQVFAIPGVLSELQKQRQTRFKVKHNPQWEMTVEMQDLYEQFQILYHEVKK